MSKKYKINLEDRQFLQQLREEARKKTEIKGTNPDWIRVYWRLVDVAGELDAYIARTEIKG